mmetsp:Transcript_35468/g.104879  ORF Transcript_35468/g.104879 Transcript_35468/m.104879 type:complete len:88 (+) Transcript_35468:229-492(+)
MMRLAERTASRSSGMAAQRDACQPVALAWAWPCINVGAARWRRVYGRAERHTPTADSTAMAMQRGTRCQHAELAWPRKETYIASEQR